MTSPTNGLSQYQNYSLSSQYGAPSSTSSVPNMQSTLNNTTAPISNSGSNSVSSSMGGANNTPPFTSYAMKSPVNQGQTSPYTFSNKNIGSKPSITSVFSPSSLNRNNIPTSTLGSNYTGIQTSYNYTGSSNPPQTNFWRKN